MMKELKSKVEQKKSMQKTPFPQAHYIVLKGKVGLTASNSLKKQNNQTSGNGVVASHRLETVRLYGMI